MDAALSAGGWYALRVWEHDLASLEVVSDRVADAVVSRGVTGFELGSRRSSESKGPGRNPESGQ